MAEVLFGTVNVDAFFWNTITTAAGFRAAALRSPGQAAGGAGLDHHENGELENPEGVKARLEEAAKYVAKEQICLSPQCGFASTEEGNSLSESQQWDKVRLVTQIASEVW